MATFNEFPKLPGEIQNMIWSFAIRDDRPGVHIFRSKKCASKSRFEKAWIGSGPKLDPFPSFPSVKGDDPIRKNESTYLIDAGLWMACKESRAIIENHFTIPKWTIRQCKDQSIDDAGDYSVSLEDCAWSKRALPLRIGPVEKGIALPDGKSLEVSKPDYFWGSPLPQLTTSQQRDFFVLQAWSLREVDWNHLSFDFGFGPCTLRPRYGLNNIGVVYNSTWWHKKNEDWKPHVIEILSRYSSEARLNPVDIYGSSTMV
ncbi:hypothetical protein NW752_002441 [Fusarium irregulare]|uniref:2EXR domain-containing protein n=1 Tax=Fusarium irregulare TaxID=2494466 RepID=A0A9W8U5W8_9HYPO|nr:hypothetical protein NW766_011158 [Fusarium irregulare]KAJ4024985.1 hypothetical protein NW752_002441 [Fusarium irregulare]